MAISIYEEGIVAYCSRCVNLITIKSSTKITVNVNNIANAKIDAQDYHILCPECYAKLIQFHSQMQKLK
jgi:hypothetical protein